MTIITIQMRNNDEQCALRLPLWVGGPTLVVDGRSPPELSGALQPVHAGLTPNLSHKSDAP